jgi:hypothetical protein
MVVLNLELDPESRGSFPIEVFSLLSRKKIGFEHQSMSDAMLK